MQEQLSETHTHQNRLKSLLSLLAIGLFILLTDQVSKYLILQNLDRYDSWEPIPGFGNLFKFTYITNSGAAFGLFPNSGNIFLVVAIVVAIAIIYYIYTYPSTPWLVRFAFGLQLGGAIGNMIDRVQHGSVIDFVDIGFWPIFNVADISIVFGVIILGFWVAEEEKREAERALNSQG